MAEIVSHGVIQTWVEPYPEGPLEAIFIKVGEGAPKDLRRGAPFLAVSPCPWCSQESGHDPLKHVDPRLGMKPTLFDQLVLRAARAKGNDISDERVFEQFIEEGYPPFWVRQIISRAK